MTVDDSQGLKNRAVVWIESLLPVTGRLAQNFLKQVLTIKTPVLSICCVISEHMWTFGLEPCFLEGFCFNRM